MKTLTNEECRARHVKDYLPQVTDTKIYALSPKGHGNRHFDNGNPLVGNGHLIVVLSWVVPCARGIPDAYTRISSFVDSLVTKRGT